MTSEIRKFQNFSIFQDKRQDGRIDGQQCFRRQERERKGLSDNVVDRKVVQVSNPSKSSMDIW